MAKHDKKSPETSDAQVGSDQDNTQAAVEQAEATPDDAAAKAGAVAAVANEAAEKAQAEADSTEGLVKMHKNGEHLHVHPTTVEAHKAAGWAHA